MVGRRSPPTGGIERSRDGHGISSQSNSRQGLLLYRRCASQREIALALPTSCESQRLVDQTPDSSAAGAPRSGSRALASGRMRARGARRRPFAGSHGRADQPCFWRIARRDPLARRDPHSYSRRYAQRGAPNGMTAAHRVRLPGLRGSTTPPLRRLPVRLRPIASRRSLG
jgi:hypothetical protein